ncbi:hypothetical protein K438DRAFT_1828910 [Mycena galopus ATCC 62051]|nr:hypothetical protein K438DRAFT_1828910 [Mycena galopus ATCC 62051]
MVPTHNNDPVVTQRRTNKSGAAAPDAGAEHDKENETARPTRARVPSAKARAAAEADDEHNDDDDGDNYKADEDDSGDEDSQADQQPARGRGGREFQNREVEVHAKKAKTLVQRDSRIPSIPLHRPTISRKESDYNSAILSSQSGSDWRRSSRDEMEVDEEDRRPRGVNGNPLPPHIRLDLSTFPQYRAEQWAAAPRHHRSTSSERGRDRVRPASPLPRRHLESTPGVHREHAGSSSSDPRRHRELTPDRDLARGYTRSPSPPPLPQRRYREPSPDPNQHHESAQHARPLSPEHHRAPVASTSRRPLSPAPGSKRARSPAEDFRQTQAQKINDHQGRARAKDYDSTTQEIVATAVMYFRCLLATVDGFPDHASETHLLNLAWAMARDEHKIEMDLTPDIAKLITSQMSQMRGEVKSEVRGLIELTFGFASGQNKKNIRKNHQLAEDLKEDMGYAYEVNPSKSQGRKGLYKAGIIQKTTNLMWFGNRRAEGAMNPEMFGPALPKPTLALVLTAIECGIDEWATGIKTDVPFTSADYRTTYTDHIASLTAFEKRSAPRDILGNILTRLHNVGRFHSGSQPLVAARTISLSTSAIDAAIKEYDENSETETEGEFGDDDDDSDA